MQDCLADDLLIAYHARHDSLGAFLQGPLGEKIVSFPSFCSKKQGFCSLPHTYKGRRLSFSKTEIIHSPYMVEGFISRPETSINSQIHDNPQSTNLFMERIRGNQVVPTCQCCMVSSLMFYTADTKRSTKLPTTNGLAFQGYSQIVEIAKG